jgi:hypothetical protein
MLIWLMVLLLGDGADGGGGGSPTPDAPDPLARRRLGAFVKRGGVGRLRRLS